MDKKRNSITHFSTFDISFDISRLFCTRNINFFPERTSLDDDDSRGLNSKGKKKRKIIQSKRISDASKISWTRRNWRFLALG